MDYFGAFAALIILLAIAGGVVGFRFISAATYYLRRKGDETTKMDSSRVERNQRDFL